MAESSQELWNRLVNSKWAPYKPTEQEALTGAKRLWRKAMGRAWRGKWKITSGNRSTWIRGRTFYVNPSERDGGYTPPCGWHQIVHSIAHLAHRRLHPGHRPHSTAELYLERDLTDYAIASGFLEGRLKRPTKEKSPRDVVAERAARVEARIKAWTEKKKRADNALRKLRLKQRYYQKKA